jgi:hypothetical protein
MTSEIAPPRRPLAPLGRNRNETDCTTKRTKDTKDSEVDIFQILDFVLFASFVVNEFVANS